MRLHYILYFLFAFLFLLPRPCYAYLDPGTGNALVYVLMTFLGAMVFSLKGLFYRIIGKQDQWEQQRDMERDCGHIVIFSEGHVYWPTFAPIVRELLKRKVRFSYYTMDIEDPCLTMDEEMMNNRYIGHGNRAYAQISHLEADVVLSTTPNIGTANYPIQRSKNIKELIHVFHAFDDLSMYHRGSLDHYDAVFLVGDFEEPILRKLERMHQSKEKKLIPVGLPYWDDMLARAEKFRKCGNAAPMEDRKTILVAPSWGEKGLLSVYGGGFLKGLLQAGYRVILRPHPQSWKHEPDLLASLQEDLAGFPAFSIDREVDGTGSLQVADLMVSDTSAVRLDFLFLYERPVVTLEMPYQDFSAFEYADLQESWKEKELAKLGAFVPRERVGELPEIVRSLIESEQPAAIRAFREAHVYHFGCAGAVAAEALVRETEAVAATLGRSAEVGE